MPHARHYDHLYTAGHLLKTLPHSAGRLSPSVNARVHEADKAAG